MIRVLMLDLGGTLTDGQVVFPHVRTALEALAGLKTAAGEPLRSCLVSDFHMPDPPVTPAEIDAVFAEYLEILRRLDLRRFFEPVEQRVTLSTHAGRRKPDREVFDTALQRLGVPALLDECLLITEDEGHLQGARNLGMTPLRFDRGGAGDFSDWSEAPLLVAHLLGLGGGSTPAAALNARLGATHGMELTTMAKDPVTGSITGRGRKLHPVGGARGGAGETVHVPLPVEAEVDLDSEGRVRGVRGGEPDAEAVSEAAAYVESLEANRQIAHDPGPLPPGTTHQLEEDDEGRQVLKRKRFSAI